MYIGDKRGEMLLSFRRLKGYLHNYKNKIFTMKKLYCCQLKYHGSLNGVSSVKTILRGQWVSVTIFERMYFSGCWEQFPENGFFPYLLYLAL